MASQARLISPRVSFSRRTISPYSGLSGSLAVLPLLAALVLVMMTVIPSVRDGCGHVPRRGAFRAARSGSHKPRDADSSSLDLGIRLDRDGPVRHARAAVVG